MGYFNIYIKEDKKEKIKKLQINKNIKKEENNNINDNDINKRNYSLI